MGLFDFLGLGKAKEAEKAEPSKLSQPVAVPARPVPQNAPVQPAPQAFNPTVSRAGAGVEPLRPTQDLRSAAVTPLNTSEERRSVVPRTEARAGLKVLIIDDSPTVVAMLSRMLKQNYFHPIEAYDAEQGIELAKQHQPALIFLDIVLPGMNGFNALRAMRRDAATAHIPVIMISGNQQATEEFYVQRIGAQDFMKKPFSRAEVFARIERLLGKELLPKRAESAADQQVA